jgi:hypothetical protein
MPPPIHTPGREPRPVGDYLAPARNGVQAARGMPREPDRVSHLQRYTEVSRLIISVSYAM